MKGVYIHIPFCSSICSYCDFCKMIYNPQWSRSYLESLNKEIDEYYENDIVKSIYIGGGTPSSISNEDLDYLFTIINKFKLNEHYEFTFELNINDITKGLLIYLKNHGVNRLSIGIESFNKFKLKFLNRKHTQNEIIEKIKLVKEVEFENYSVDFIYATPIEDFNMFKKDFNNIIKLDSPHISTYSLIIEEGTVLSINGCAAIEEDLDAKMYDYICKKLNKKGYNHYEVSNFSLPGFESIHNLIYWNNEEYYGFGLGAHGFVNNVRYSNTKNLELYLNDKYRKEELFVSKNENMFNEVMLGLRKLEGIDIKKFFDKYKENIQDAFNLEELYKEGSLVLKGTMLSIPENKIYVMNDILTRMNN